MFVVVAMSMQLDAELTQRTPTGVLVVDDEPQVVWMLQFSLQAEGYETYVARDGSQALDEIRERRPKVMLLDIMMPVMDGWAVLEQVRDLRPEERPRIVVVSARSSQRDRNKAVELGADAFVAKPFNVDDLLAVLHGLTEEPSAVDGRA
jgi:two-component system, OmpR family, alkaline phosphatase synthesis response regulator PhoP